MTHDMVAVNGFREGYMFKFHKFKNKQRQVFKGVRYLVYNFLVPLKETLSPLGAYVIT